MSRDNDGTNPGNPIASARDRLQSSARDLIRNIESAIGSNSNRSNPENSLEHAFRSLFTSCTNPSPNKAEDNKSATGGAPIASKRRASSVSSRSSRAVEQNRGDKGTLRRYSSQLSSGRRASPLSRRQSSPHDAEKPSPQHVTGEHVYAQLYLEEKQTAEWLPYSQRQASSPKLLGISPNPGQTRPINTKPFPKSAPTSAPVRALSPTDGITVPLDTFDDGISAISANTLEAMASTNRLVSHIPRSPKASPIKDNRDMTPSTRTTQSSRSFDRSFEHWQNQEHQFWEAEVVTDQKVKKRTSWNLHPHETLPYEPGDLAFSVCRESEEI